MKTTKVGHAWRARGGFALASCMSVSSVLATEAALPQSTDTGATFTSAETGLTETESAALLALMEQSRAQGARGELSLALSGYAAIWERGQSLSDPVWMSRVNRSAGEYLRLMSGVGRVEAMRSVIAVYDAGRSSAGMGEMLGEARRSLWAMEHVPGGSFKCGVYALSKVGRALGLITAPGDQTLAHPSPVNGFSLSDLRQIGGEWGLGEVTPVKRAPGAALVYPMVAHLRAGHFVALLGERDGQVRVADSTLAFGKPETLLSRASLETELDGYFAVVGDIPSGYVALSATEAATVRGTGDMPVKPTVNEDKACVTGTCQTGGFGHVQLSLSSGGARFFDPLLTVDNAYGPAITVEVGEPHSKTAAWFGQDMMQDQPQAAGNWTTSWNRYIGREDNNPSGAWVVMAPTHLWRMEMGEGVEASKEGGCLVTSLSGQQEARLANCNAVNEKDEPTGTGTWELWYRDGSKEVFSPVVWQSGAPSSALWQLSSRTSALGKTVTVHHGATVEGQTYASLIREIRNENDEVAVSFVYAQVGKEPVLTQLCAKGDPVRCARIAYGLSSTNKYARVLSTTDLDGVLSRYGYATDGDREGRMNSIVTPQGKTALSQVDATDEGNLITQLDYFTRTVTEKNEESFRYAGSERVTYVLHSTPHVSPAEDAAWVPTVAEASAAVLHNVELNQRNVLHLTMPAFSLAFDSNGNGTIEASEGDKNGNGFIDGNERTTLMDSERQVTQAQIYHYTHTDENSTSPRSVQLESLQLPDAGAGVLRLWFTRAKDEAADAQDGSATYESSDPAIAGTYYVNAAGETVSQHRTYNAQGRVTQVRDAEGRVTEYDYAADGLRLTAVWLGGRAAGVKIHALTYNDADASPLPDTVTDVVGARAVTTKYDYDSYGRMLSRTDRYGHTTRFDYSEKNGLLNEITTPQPIADSQVVPIKQGFAYDDYGRLIQIGTNAPNQAWTRFEYWGVGAQLRQVSRTDRDGKVFSTQTLDWQDAAGKPTLAVHTACVQGDDGQMPACIDYSYDAWGNVIQTRDAVGAQTTLSWAGPKLQTGLLTTDGTQLSYRLNARGQVVRSQVGGTAANPTVSADSFLYDRAGQLVKHSLANGKTVQYGYTRSGLLDWINHSDIDNLTPACEGGAACDADYTWGAVYARLEAARDSYGTVAIGYGSADPVRPMQEVRALSTEFFPSGGSITRAQSYDRLGRINRLSLDGYDDAQTKTTNKTRLLYAVEDSGLDALNRVLAWQTAVGYAWRTYRGLGSQVSGEWLSRENKSEDAKTLTFSNYDTAGRMTDRQVLLPEGYDDYLPTLDSAWSEFTAYGSARQLLRADGLGSAPKALAQTFDAVNQAISQSDVSKDPIPLERVEISAGKQLTVATDRNSITQTFAVKPGYYGQLAQATQQTVGSAITTYPYSYDASGNVLSDGRNSYTWFANGQMKSKKDAAGVMTVYGYDYAGRPVLIKDGKGRSEWLEWEGATVAQVRRGNDPTWVKATYDAWGVLDHTTGRSYYRFDDRSGSPVAYVDAATDATVATLDYDLAGTPVVSLGAGVGAFPASLAAIGFQGLYTDGDSGQLITLNRHYDRFSRRWLSRDPEGPLVDGVVYAGNTYTALGNNSWTYSDPRGGSLEKDGKDGKGGNANSDEGGWVNWNVPQEVVDATAGFGDMASFGLTTRLNDLTGANGVVNACSNAYTAGSLAGAGVMVVAGVGVGARIAQGGKAAVMNIAAKSAAREAALLETELNSIYKAYWITVATIGPAFTGSAGAYAELVARWEKLGFQASAFPAFIAKKMIEDAWR